MASDPDLRTRKRLDDEMNRRRVELGLRWKDVASEAGLSYESLRAVRAGSYGMMRDLTAAGIERGLRWAPGSVKAILAGGQPTHVEAVPAARGVEEIDTETISPRRAMDVLTTIGATLGDEAFWEAFYLIADNRRRRELDQRTG
jgi:hypothetical protein